MEVKLVAKIGEEDESKWKKKS